MRVPVPVPSQPEKIYINGPTVRIPVPVEHRVPVAVPVDRYFTYLQNYSNVIKETCSNDGLMVGRQEKRNGKDAKNSSFSFPGYVSQVVKRSAFFEETITWLDFSTGLVNP